MKIGLFFGSFKKIFGYMGWGVDFDVNDPAQKLLPSVYSINSTAYAIRFVIRGFEDKKSTFDFKDSFVHADKFPYPVKSWF